MFRFIIFISLTLQFVCFLVTFCCMLYVPPNIWWDGNVTYTSISPNYSQASVSEGSWRWKATRESPPPTSCKFVGNCNPCGKKFWTLPPFFKGLKLNPAKEKEDSFDPLTRVPEKRCKLPKGVVANFIHHSPYIPILQMRDLTSNPIAHWKSRINLVTHINSPISSNVSSMYSLKTVNVVFKNLSSFHLPGFHPPLRRFRQIFGTKILKQIAVPKVTWQENDVDIGRNHLTLPVVPRRLKVKSWGVCLFSKTSSGTTEREGFLINSHYYPLLNITWIHL